MAKLHTAGPWSAYKSPGSSRLRVMSDSSPYDIATMCHAGSEDAERANAALVAAAPRLLESLQWLVNTIESAWSERQITAPRFVQCQLGEEVKRAKEAIRQAAVH